VYSSVKENKYVIGNLKQDAKQAASLTVGNQVLRSIAEIVLREQPAFSASCA